MNASISPARGSAPAEIAGLLILLLLFATPAAGADPGTKPPSTGPVDPVGAPLAGDARAAADGKACTSIFLPDTDLFRPILADMKQTGFYAGLRRVHFRGEALPAGANDDHIKAAVVAIGGDFGLWGHRRPNVRDGFQVNLTAGIFSQFNLDTPSEDLINTDFVVGLPVTWRRGEISSRVRLFHQSSHLGDEFLLDNPGVDRVDLSYEAVDFLLSWEHDFWRLYGGGGYMVLRNPDLEPGSLQWGLELRGPSHAGGPGCSVRTPIFGADFNAFGERHWSITGSVKTGLEFTRGDGRRHFRMLLVYLRGYVPFGQFFSNEKIENFGLEIQVGG